MEERIETMETELVEDYELAELEQSGGGIFGKILIGLGLVAGAAGVAAVANRDKIKAWNTKRRIAKLEKAGYGVITPEDMELLENGDVDVVEEAE